LTAAEFEQLNRVMQSKGFIAQDFSIYFNPDLRIVATWVQRGNYGYEVRYGLTRDEFKLAMQSFSQNNVQLRHLVAYLDGSDYRYGGIWEHDVIRWFASWDLTDGQYQKDYDFHVAAGHVIDQVLAYGQYFGALWHEELVQ
jgi:hypothetical protein